MLPPTSTTEGTTTGQQQQDGAIGTEATAAIVPVVVVEDETDFLTLDDTLSTGSLSTATFDTHGNRRVVSFANDNATNAEAAAAVGAPADPAGVTVVVVPTTVEALRRSQQQQEESLRDVTPVRVNHNRVRLNQLTRSRRHESPMDPDAFRRHHGTTATTTTNDDAPTPRMMAISVGDRGTMAARPISEVPVSHKQGPSHRKARRWRNDHFDDLATAVKTEHGSHGHRAADALRKAKEKAHLYRDIVNFKDMQSDTLTQFINNDKLQVLRDKFFDGELPTKQQQSRRGDKPATRPEKMTAQEKLYRVDTRLRRVVTKACRNSQPAAMVVKTFESFVRATFSYKKQKNRTGPAGQWWCTLLTEQPTVTKRRDGQLTVQFLFDADSSTGGFHRLLLHAVCQYHGLRALSKMVDIEENSHRALIVTGEAIRHKHKLLDLLIDDAGEIAVLEEPWTMTDEAEAEDEWSVV